MGIFIGQEGGEAVLSDFAGNVLQSVSISYDDPADVATPKLIYDTVMEMTRIVDGKHWKRHVGICIAAGESVLGLYCGRMLPRTSFTGMRQPLAASLEEAFGVPVHCINDIRAACLAEISLGSATADANMLYFNLGMWLGSGIILEGRLIGDEACLSSSIHSLPVRLGDREAPVGDFASLAPLKLRVEEAGLDFQEQKQNGFADSQLIFEIWRKQAIEALVPAIRSAKATVPLDSVTIEGCLGASALSAFIDDLRGMLVANDIDIKVVNGSFGSGARALGTAMVPFFKVFGPEEAGHSTQQGRAVA